MECVSFLTRNVEFHSRAQEGSNSDLAEALCVLARAHLHQHEYRSALPVLSRALELMQTSSSVVDANTLVSCMGDLAYCHLMLDTRDQLVWTTYLLEKSLAYMHSISTTFHLALLPIQFRLIHAHSLSGHSTAVSGHLSLDLLFDKTMQSYSLLSASSSLGERGLVSSASKHRSISRSSTRCPRRNR